MHESHESILPQIVIELRVNIQTLICAAFIMQHNTLRFSQASCQICEGGLGPAAHAPLRACVRTLTPAVVHAQLSHMILPCLAEIIIGVAGGQPTSLQSSIALHNNLFQQALVEGGEVHIEMAWRSKIRTHPKRGATPKTLFGKLLFRDEVTARLLS